MSNHIEIVGARTNNLQSVDVRIPLQSATMVVGVSGSGKSSLLADSLATEANGRMRRFLGVSQDHLSSETVPAFIGPLPPCIHFAQGAFHANRRSTVATASGCLALLRLYFRRYSRPWAEEVSQWVLPPSPDTYGAWIRNHSSGALTLWVVVARWERTDGVRAAALLKSHGLETAVIRSETDTAARAQHGRKVDLDRFRPLSDKVKHIIEAEVGKLKQSGKSDELSNLLDRAFGIGGEVIVEFHRSRGLPEELHGDRGILLETSRHWVHPRVRLPFSPPSDALLSFNSPSNPAGGACRTCKGLGVARTLSVARLVAHPEHGLHDGALSLWTPKNYRYVNIQHATIEGLRGLQGFSPETPWRQLSAEARQLILFGSGTEQVTDIDPATGRKLSKPRVFPGFVVAVLRRLEGRGAAARELENLTEEGPCKDCRGTRWSREARALRLGPWNLPAILTSSFDELAQLSKPGGRLERDLPDQARSLSANMHATARAFICSGLGHLSGDRGMTTLSEGESRRSRLATLLRASGSGLGLLLDEPARGLHEEDVARLANALDVLKQRNTLILNEHRLSLAAIADQVLEIGPGAGQRGGRIVNSGPPAQIFTSNWFPTFQRTLLKIREEEPNLHIKGARIHNINGVDCRIPLGRLVSITGVSGSGKSSFIRGVLLPALMETLPGRVDCEGFPWPGGAWEALTGSENIQTVMALEPRTPLANRRSTVATLLSLAEGVRRIFGATAEAKKAGFRPMDFGWNGGRGRCQTCQGLGEIEDGTQWVSCPHCGGSRFGEETLGIRVQGLNVAELLDLPIIELQNHPFAMRAQWRPLIEQLISLDLGYLTLGRRVDRISGGEHQRLRIARTLGTSSSERLLLVLDEPSAGLHPRDASRLLAVLDRIVAKGHNSVVLVEHNLSLIRASDWVIDFGPGGGPAGGRIVGEGPPKRIQKSATPTGRALRGAPLHSSSTMKPESNPLERAGAPSRNSVNRGKQWLKRLLGQETASEETEPVDFEGLAAWFKPEEHRVRPYEIGGLDVEIARLLLDRPDDWEREPQHLAKIWAEYPSARLEIHPLLEEIRVWGSTLPASVLSEARQRLERMGLKCDMDINDPSGLVSLRATGSRFLPKDTALGERVCRVREAMGIGGGVAFLRDRRDGDLAKVCTRPIDLKIPAVAPLSAGPACLLRGHPIGSCLCCLGAGTVQIFEESLVVGNAASDPEREDFYHPEAFKILRGLRRNMLLPFLKRMAREGLWSNGRAFRDRNLEEKRILMHGYWHRPGPGSFLKAPNSDPGEVRSWLRWNGLFRAVLEESGRSKASQWVDSLKRTSRQAECPECDGTGLLPHAQAIRLGSFSFFDWVRQGTLQAFVKALENWKPVSTRSAKTLKRILYCLEPICRAHPGAPLRQTVDDSDLARAVFQRIVERMTRLKVLG